MGSLKTLPGVIDTSARDAPGWGSVGGMSINGQTSFNFSYDGVTNKDTGSNSGNYAAPALDSIAEVKVQASNFQAEYGRSSGATITVVTKSGTRDFRGTAAYYRRNEKFNTNTWDRRRQCDAGQVASCAKAPYRFDNTAWTIGGPVLVPGTGFNQNRDKLFFFFSQDLLPQNRPRDAAAEHHADRPRALGGLLADVRQPGPRALDQGSEPGRAGVGVQRQYRRAWLLPGQPDSGEPHQRDRPADAESVPAAERDRSVRQPPVQLHLPEPAREAAQRPGGAR